MAEVRLDQCCLAYPRLWVTSPALRDKGSNKSKQPCPGSHRPSLQTSVYLFASWHYFLSGRKQKSSRKQQKLWSTKNKSMQKASNRIVPLYICHSRKTANSSLLSPHFLQILQTLPWACQDSHSPLISALLFHQDFKVHSLYKLCTKFLSPGSYFWICILKPCRVFLHLLIKFIICYKIKISNNKL